MPTQISSTPTLAGHDAKQLLDSLKKPTSAKAVQNGNRLIDFFSRMETSRIQSRSRHSFSSLSLEDQLHSIKSKRENR